MPKEWTTDKKRCQKAGIPPEEQKYRTKPELGLEIIKELEGFIEYDWIGGDSVYGNSPELRQSLRELGKASVLDVGEELQVCLEKPQPFVPKRVGKGRPRTQLVIDEAKISLKKLVEEIEEGEWQTFRISAGNERQTGERSGLEKSVDLEKRDG